MSLYESQYDTATTTQTTLRLRDDIRERVEEIAARDRRSIASVVNLVLADALGLDGGGHLTEIERRLSELEARADAIEGRIGGDAR